MDDTQLSRVSDAAATRKRRSSILKSQRPPRTPFSDLEFNVATPTDSAKSRRVSFSRRTGVAEFATNEATTTWKNFYEEHNKSLETSGGEPGSRQPVAHLGQRAFDQQFEEVEADFIKSLNTGPNSNISSSLNNFEQQLASLECTDDVKLTAPHNNFELSAFTNTNTKLFDDLAIPSGEVTDRIDINFSAVQQIGGDDDLDEIQKDLKQNFGNAPFQRQSISEYIEVDLNMTNVMKNDDDISITDTVNSLVQDMSKNTSNKNLDKDWMVDKENVAINPYVAPRETENFAINEELDKVLVFDGKRLTIQSEKEDKENYRKTLLPNASDKAPQRKNIVLNVNDDLPNFIDDPISNNSGFIGVAELKKSLIIDDMSITEPLEHIKQLSTMNVDVLGNMSVTQAVPSVIPEGHRTVLYEDNGNISVTKAIPTNIIEGKRMTIFDDSNISITQSLPTNVQEATAQSKQRRTIVFDDGDLSMTQALPVNIIPNKTKRRTIVYEDTTGNLSITQAVPNILIKEANAEKRRTIVYEGDTGNISVTQAIPSNIIIAENSCDRRRTVVFESDTGNISVTQAVPSSLVLQEQMNMNLQAEQNTQVQIENTRRRTIVYEDDTGNLSITQAVPNQIIQGMSTKNLISHDAKVPTHTAGETNRRRTIVFDNDNADISVTQAVSLNQVICALKNDMEINYLKNDAKENQIQTDLKENQLKRDIETNKADKIRTVVFNNENADISVTQAANLNQIIPGFVQNVHDDLEAALNEALHSKDTGKSERKIAYSEGNTRVSQNCKELVNISVSLRLEGDEADNLSVPMNVIQDLNKLCEEDIPSKTELISRTVDFENDETDISMTQAVSSNRIIPGIVQNAHDDLEIALNEALHSNNTGKSQRTVAFDEDCSKISQNYKENLNISISLSLQDNVIENAVKRRTVVFEDNNTSMIKVHNMNTKCSHLEEPDTAGTLDVSVIDMDNAKKSTNKQVDNVIRKSINSDRKSVITVTKPIPSNLLTFIGEDSVSATKYSDVESSSLSVSNVLVYQAALSKRTEQGDSKSQEPIAIENNENMSSSSKITDDVKYYDDKLSSSKIADAIEVKSSSESASDSWSQAEKPMTESQEIPESQDMAEQTNQSETNDDLSESSDATSLMSKSILNDLLDMSSTNGVEDKGLTAKVDTKETDSNNPSMGPKSDTGTNSNDTLFYITKDAEDEAQIQTDKCDSTELPQLTEHSPLPLDYRKDEPQAVVDLKNKTEILKDAVGEETSLNRHYEKILGSDVDKAKKGIVPKESKSFKTANDTNELLEMLSDLTDRTMPRNLDTHLEEDEEKPKPILIKRHLALENKSELCPEPKRLSFATTRQSIVMTREDFLNNISLAGAALKSRCFEDSDLNTTEESPEDTSPKKSVRLSSEVVKTLHFDDSDSSIQHTKTTPLKKTAFGETSYMEEHKAKVIPDYLKYVSDGIKELMDDLVKPNADVLPFDAAGIDTGVRKVPSTCSTHIQANLVTSSQIDCTTGLYSNTDSVYDVNVNKISSVDMINDAVNRSVSRALKSPIKSSRASEKSFESKMDVSITDVKTIVPSRTTKQSPGRVLIFDHNNPLNNILLGPETITDVHRYNPGKSTDSICISERSHSVQMSINEKDNYEVERVSTQYNVGNLIHSVKQSGDASSGKIPESQSKASNLSKTMSIDQSTEAKLIDMKNTEVNTVIAMKGNKELLDASSSLTLVDDALARSTFDAENNSRTTTSQEDMSKSPVKVIYAVNRDDMVAKKLDSDLTSNDDLDDRKSKKRVYSPTKRDKHQDCTIPNLDITPKPTAKMLKLSNTPDEFKAVEVLLSTEKLEKEDTTEKLEKKKKSPRKSKSKMPGTSITVQQLMTVYNVGPIDHETLDEQIKDLIRDPKSDSSSIEPMQTASQPDVQECKSLDMVSSFTSSKNLREDRSGVISSQSSKVSRMDWQPEIIDDLSSKNLLSECDSSVNVVAKIDMLPFMGSHECEWESCCGDTWTFRLLHGRLRLAARLAHRVHNATRTRVRADTPVRALTLHAIPHDTKNTLATLCVSFAAETMRYFVSRGCACAGDVPALVRRCAAAARLAARWARSMSEARARLAYCLAPDATLTLKVANVPLRCVWEVSMRLELVVGEGEGEGEAPWVRAAAVRVRRVLPAPQPPAPGVAAPGEPEPRLPRALAQLPRDWSHAPRTIWRIFKYLKHKTRDNDDELFMLV